MKQIGYKARDTISHRRYSFKTSMARFVRTKKYTYRGVGKMKGSGHRAGEAWGEQKNIDPRSRVRKYSKNSPSFDEGVHIYKAKAAALKRAQE